MNLEPQVRPVARAALSCSNTACSSLLRDWLREAGVRWGRDAEQRARFGLPDDPAFTWRQGLDRLLLGFAAPPQLAGAQAPLPRGLSRCRHESSPAR